MQRLCVAWGQQSPVPSEDRHSARPSQSKRRLQPSPLWPQSRSFHKPSDQSVKAQCLQISYSSLWKFGIDNSWQLGCRNSFNHLQQFISKSNWTVRCCQLPPFQRVWSGPTLPLRTVASPHLPPPGRTGMARTIPDIPTVNAAAAPSPQSASRSESTLQHHNLGSQSRVKSSLNRFGWNWLRKDSVNEQLKPKCLMLKNLTTWHSHHNWRTEG